MSVHLAWQAIVYQSVNKYLSSGLPPFFDNLVAEGWLEKAQTRLQFKAARLPL
jgi:hypothetical protein